jgi:thiamine pyrophosphate-dependent acetolactate synthase large subunit-like protein
MYAEVNVEQAREAICKMDIETAERGVRHYQAGVTKVKAEIAALRPESRGQLANLSRRQTDLEWLLNECGQRIEALLARVTKPAEIKWTKTLRELGDDICARFDRRELDAASKRQAVIQECKRYTKEDGTPVNGISVWQSLRNREDYER